MLAPPTVTRASCIYMEPRSKLHASSSSTRLESDSRLPPCWPIGLVSLVPFLLTGIVAARRGEDGGRSARHGEFSACTLRQRHSDIGKSGPERSGQQGKLTVELDQCVQIRMTSRLRPKYAVLPISRVDEEML